MMRVSQYRRGSMATTEELANRYLEMSSKHLRQAQEELGREDLTQASEKAWGATAEALKALAVVRGSNHKSHGLLRDIATQLYMELGRRSILDLFGTLENAHVNFYEHRFDRDEVQYQIDNCRELLRELERVRALPVRRFTPANREQERRLERLTRYSPDRAVDAALDIETLPRLNLKGSSAKAGG